MTQQYQKSEWTGTDEPTPRTARRARKQVEQMKNKILKRDYVVTDSGFHFTHKDIKRVLNDLRDAMGPERKTDFMVFAFGVLRYHGKARSVQDLQPQQFDAVGFALMEKQIELRKAST
jgi:hypothetical protein